MTVWQSEVDGLAVRQEVRVRVRGGQQYDLDFPPSPLPAFTAWLADVIKDIPAEYHATATVEIDSTSSYYDSHYATVEVTYRRPETDEEWAARKADVMARVEAQQREERVAYEALKAKFEAPCDSGSRAQR